MPGPPRSVRALRGLADFLGDVDQFMDVAQFGDGRRHHAGQGRADALDLRRRSGRKSRSFISPNVKPAMSANAVRSMS